MSIYDMVREELPPVATKTVLNKILVEVMPSYRDQMRTMRKWDLAPIIRKHVTVGVKYELEKFSSPPTISDPRRPLWNRLVKMNTELVGITSDDSFWSWYNRNA